MANVDSPKGLKIGGPLLRATWYSVAASQASAIFIGDPVIATGTSNQVIVATAGSASPITGAVIGVFDNSKLPGIAGSDGVRVAYAASVQASAFYVLVADHPDQVFIAQGDGDTSYLDINDCSGNVNLVAGAGNTTSGISGWELDDSDTGDGGVADQIRLIRPVDRPDNTVGIANCDWYCRINNHQLNAGIVGVGV
jgi:hypothetical protein